MSYQCNLSGMCWTVNKMIYWRVMLCAVISQVFSARAPLESEFSMDHAAAQPVESHVHGIGALGDDGVAGDSHDGGIIGLYGRLPLGPFHFYESLAQGYHVLADNKKSR